jgi:NAD(P)-dependent dehydrogenase (short-subunit alcohol dehydrogenase family)
VVYKEVLMRLKDRVAIVTGAAQGIGRTIALGLAEEGAGVVIADILDGLSVQRAIEEKGGKALALYVDVGNAKSVNDMVAKTMERFGRIDVLINNAAIFSTLTRNPFYLVTDEEWDRVMRVNVKGPFLCCKAVYPHMKKIGKGKIVNISSGTFWEGLGNRVHYITSKAGIIGLTRAIARDAGGDGIRVNAIAPGYTMTEIQKERAPGNQEQIQSTINARCIKRDEEPQDLLGAIIFLSCDESDFITGQTLVVDGGRVMH